MISASKLLELSSSTAALAAVTPTLDVIGCIDDDDDDDVDIMAEGPGCPDDDDDDDGGGDRSGRES